MFAALLASIAAGCGSQSPVASAPAKVGGFPEDIPIYDGLQQDYVSDSGPLLVVNGLTSDSIEKVTAFYRERLPAIGWTEGSDPTQGGGGGKAMVFNKGQTKIVILVSKDEGKTRVSLQVEGYEGAK